MACVKTVWRLNFNPRPPRGERLLVLLQSFDDTRISIHALREESDWRKS